MWRRHPETEDDYMHSENGQIPAYNVQAAVDDQHSLIVAQQVTDQAADNRHLQPMAEAAQAAVGGPAHRMNVVADAGHSHRAAAQASEAGGILAHVPHLRGGINNGNGTPFRLTQFPFQHQNATLSVP